MDMSVRPSNRAEDVPYASQKEFLDLNDACISKIFHCLWPLDLCLIADTNSRLRTIARSVFVSQYKNWRFQLPATILTSKVLGFTRNRLLVNFGDLINGLSLYEQEWSYGNTITIFDFIDQHFKDKVRLDVLEFEQMQTSPFLSTDLERAKPFIQSVKKLVFMYCTSLPSDALNVASYDTLKTLEIINCRIETKKFIKLIKTIGKFRKLEELKFCLAYQLADEHLKFFYGLTEVTTIRLHKYNKITSNGLVNLVANLPKLQYIFLTWSSVPLPQSAYEQMVDLCRKKKRTLFIKIKKFPDDSVGHFEGNCPEIVNIEINETNLIHHENIYWKIDAKSNGEAFFAY